MEMRIYSVYDKKAQFYSPPFYVRTEEEAWRALAMVLQNPEHAFTQNTEDYILWYLGKFNDQNGSIISEPREDSPLRDLKPNTPLETAIANTKKGK